ncbi:MAG TPA: phosphatidylserine/phosphatidylglycerophosphate/cardiolipin synthase family protein [Kofleriaceae bacterium]|nr:phosphatidylserine/phosphatidylglycerophosphate/cardiolipin synthase family protein [Kofleriaceae bacterium]
MRLSSALPLFVLLAGACADTSDPASTPPDGAGGKQDSAEPIEDFCNATDPRAMPVEVAVTPDAGEQPYLDALTSAQHSIDVEIYLMGYGGILDTLVAKAHAGVKVRVILDQYKMDTNQKYFTQLAAAGAEVKWSSAEFTYQHSKVLVVDGTTAVISTGNYSKSYSIELERNHVATDRDPADLADLVALFEADWTGQPVQMPCTRMVISPINSRTRILDLINSATQTLTIESMQFADYKVREAVKARVQAGVDVRALIADAGFVSANAAAADYLKGLGVTVKWIPHLHTKVIVADGARAYLGSENLSQTSLDKNREVGLIVTDAASIAPLSTSFETDWTAGTAF